MRRVLGLYWRVLFSLFVGYSVWVSEYAVFHCAHMFYCRRYDCTVCRGLAAVHAYDSSLCHRDVKSFNFLGTLPASLP